MEITKNKPNIVMPSIFMDLLRFGMQDTNPSNLNKSIKVQQITLFGTFFDFPDQ